MGLLSDRRSSESHRPVEDENGSMHTSPSQPCTVKMNGVSQDTVPAAPRIDYWHESRQPLTSLVFIAPLLVVYEVGVLLPAGTAARNGVDSRPPFISSSTIPHGRGLRPGRSDGAAGRASRDVETGLGLGSRA